MFSKRVKELREKYCLLQSGLAHEIGVTKQTISNYETGKRIPCISDLIKLADYFEVSVDYLIGRTDYPKEEFKKIYYSVIQEIDIPISFTDNQIEILIRKIADSKDYHWSENKDELKIK